MNVHDSHLCIEAFSDVVGQVDVTTLAALSLLNREWCDLTAPIMEHHKMMFIHERLPFIADNGAYTLASTNIRFNIRDTRLSLDRFMDVLKCMVAMKNRPRGKRMPNFRCIFDNNLFDMSWGMYDHEWEQRRCVFTLHTLLAGCECDFISQNFLLKWMWTYVLLRYIEILYDSKLYPELFAQALCAAILKKTERFRLYFKGRYRQVPDVLAYHMLNILDRIPAKIR